MRKNIITALFGLVAMLWTIGFIVIHPYSTSSTNDIYLIPEGHEGDIRVNYVNAAGERTPIDKLCVCVKGNGSSEIDSTITRHTDLSLTRTKCGEDYMVWGC
ncbi:hypothetical protein [Paenibacillus sp. MMO-58]|uniref:hypothetical protein n=1 Tax=Paenibacillus sp. MMO-58 TaxID=3081290 RepID=UPI003018F50A